MGCDATATLFYGFNLYDDDLPADMRDDWEESFAKHAGVLAPTEPYPETEQSTSESRAILAKYHAYWDAKREVVKACPCEIGWHGSDQEQYYYVAVKESVISAAWGDPKEVPMLGTKREWIDQIQHFCKTLNIPFKPGLSWYLVATYF